MKMLLSLAWRNLWRNKRRTAITVSSVAFAVVLAVALVSMAVGLREHMIETVVRHETGYLQVQDAMYDEEPSMDHALEYGDDVRAALAPFGAEINYTVPRIRGFALAAKETASRGVLVTGIDPDKEDRMNNLSDRIVEGTMFGPDDDYAVIAAGLADLLGISLGDEIVLMGQGFQGMTAAGQYRIGGIIRFPVPEQNNAMVYLPLRVGQSFFAAPDRLTNLIIMTDHDVDHAGLAGDIRSNLDEEWYAVMTWDQLLPDIVGLIEMREAVNQIMALVLYMVVGFGIFGTIVTMLYERLREFGILLSIGMKRARLAYVCFMETIMISLTGVAAGTIIAYPLMVLFHVHPLRFSGDMAQYMLDMGLEPIIPFAISSRVFIHQAAIIFCIALFIGIYPVKKVFQLDPVSAARK